MTDEVLMVVLVLGLEVIINHIGIDEEDTNMINYHFQPQSQHHHQHLIRHCCHPSPWIHL